MSDVCAAVSPGTSEVGVGEQTIPRGFETCLLPVIG